MTFLSQELEKYFDKKGKKYAFRNGMSLNKLAWEMSARLGFAQVDPSVLSKAVNGIRLLSREQLEVLCEILGLSEKEKEELMNALQKDLLTKEGFEDFPYLVKDEELER